MRFTVYIDAFGELLFSFFRVYKSVKTRRALFSRKSRHINEVRMRCSPPQTRDAFVIIKR